MKVAIVPQNGFLFTENLSPRQKGSDKNEKIFTICLVAAMGKTTVYGNKAVTNNSRAYINVQENQLLALLDEAGLLPENGEAEADMKKLPAGMYKAHQKAGLNKFELVSTETLKAQYTDQQPAGSLRTGKTYVDKKGEPVFRGVRAWVIEGYTVTSPDGVVVYDSTKDMAIFNAKWENGLTTLSPIIQALQTAIKHASECDGTLASFTSDQTGRIPMPQDTTLIAGARVMSKEEIAERSRINTAVGRPAIAAPTVEPGEQPATVGASATAPTTGEVTEELEKVGKPAVKQPALVSE